MCFITIVLEKFLHEHNYYLTPNLGINYTCFMESDYYTYLPYHFHMGELIRFSSVMSSQNLIYVVVKIVTYIAVIL